MFPKRWLKVDFRSCDGLRIRFKAGSRWHSILLPKTASAVEKLAALEAAWAVLGVRTAEDVVVAIERVLKFTQSGILHLYLAISYMVLSQMRKDSELMRKSEFHRARARSLGCEDFPTRKSTSKIMIAAAPLGFRVSYKQLSFVVAQEGWAEILMALVEMLRLDELQEDSAMMPRVLASIHRLEEAGSPDLLFFLYLRLFELDSSNQFLPTLRGRWRYYLSKAAEAGSVLAKRELMRSHQEPPE